MVAPIQGVRITWARYEDKYHSPPASVVIQVSTAEGEARQAEQVSELYRLLFSHPSVEAITWWDFSDRGAWQGAAAGLTRQDLSPKPAYERLHARIKGDWWTRAQGVTTAQGQYALRAFCGLHKVTVDLPNGRQISRVVPWKHGQSNRCEIVAG